MINMKDNNEISDEELKAITQAIRHRYGIDFSQYEKKSLKRGVSRLMQKNGIYSMIDLWSTILRDRAFFNKCIDDLTVNLTELFRNPQIWQALPNLLNEFKGKKEIKIWHAGCSTGEEVYSMAMIVNKCGLAHRTKLIGTDISNTALNRAKSGTYPKELISKYENSLKQVLPNHSFNDMFTFDASGAKVKASLTKNIQFEKSNLVSDVMNDTYDIIFCRNVTIYFDETLKSRVLHKLLDHLNPDGYIILGYYDVLPESARNILTQFDSNNRIYTSDKTLKKAV